MIILKTLDEIKKIKQANQIIARLYAEVLPKYIKAGVSSLEINQIIDDYIRKAGAIPACIGVGPAGNKFPTAACISINEEVVHGIPRADKIFREGDIVSIDVVTNLNGYFGDAAETFAVGTIDAQSQKLIDVCHKAREIGISMANAGTRLGDLGNAIETYVKANGFSVVETYCGHGVGKAMHEDPAVPNFGRKGRGLMIENGMVLAIEPMINMGTYKVDHLADGWTAVTKDGKRSAHCEHSVAIIDGKAVILSELE